MSEQLWTFFTWSPDVHIKVLIFDNKLQQCSTYTSRYTYSELWNSQCCCSNKIPKM